MTDRQPDNAGDPTVPLVVDLDRGLIRSDILHEACVGLLATHPWRLVRLPGWLMSGRAALKAALADAPPINPALLPLNAAVVDMLRDEKARGRRIVLISASHRQPVQALADHLGFGEILLVTENDRSPSGEAAAQKLVDQFGEACFDYLGNDLAVWSRARRVFAVSPTGRQEQQLLAQHPDAVIMRVPVPQARDYLQALRPHQWAKNTLLFLPMLAAHAVTAENLLRLLPAFLAYCLVASTVYLLNDLVDLPSDRDHHSKHRRPLANGAVPIRHAALLCLLLLLAGLGCAAMVSLPFLLLISGYFLLTTAYSLYLKRQVIVDAMTLAGLYTLRVFAGAVVLSVPLSPWMLAFCLFLFLSLALVKRYTELDARARKNGAAPTARGYRLEDMPVIGALAGASGYAAVVVLALYINTPVVSVLYPHPEGLWLICLLLLYWISRVLLLAHRGQIDDDPVVFALKDRGSLITVLLCAIIAIGSSLP